MLVERWPGKQTKSREFNSPAALQRCPQPLIFTPGEHPHLSQPTPRVTQFKSHLLSVSSTLLVRYCNVEIFRHILGSGQTSINEKLNLIDRPW